MFYETVKRILDIIISFFCLLILSPLILIVIVAIKVESPNGPIFADIPKRYGKGKSLFFMYKFRSMIPNAHNYMYNNPKLAEKYKQNNFKLSLDEDPRITKVGKFIRKTDIDEIPQFINVLIGNMSVVGPRACNVDEIDKYLNDYPQSTDNIDIALSVKPGITGIWQISGRNSISIPQRFEMDANYAKRKSVLFDLLIMFKTPLVILTRFGVYE